MVTREGKGIVLSDMPPPEAEMQEARLPLPAWFDPHHSGHVAWLRRQLEQQYGPGWSEPVVDTGAREAVMRRPRTMTQVGTARRDGVMPISFAPKKPSDGEQFAQYLSTQKPGWTMTRFEPFAGKGELRQLSDMELRCREAVSTALRAKPWDVQVRARDDEGFDLELPPTYVPSQHDGKLLDVATGVIGGDGWYVETDPVRRTAVIAKGTPPTFKASIPMPPIKKIVPYDPATKTWSRLPIGMALGTPAHPAGSVLHTDFAANPSLQISGTAGSGKGVTLTALIGSAISMGWDVALLDPSKGCVDYVDFKPFIRKNMWGDTFEGALAILEMVVEEGERRKKIIKEHRVQKFSQLPAELGIVPLMVVIDEATQLFSIPKVPAGLPKDSPVRAEMERNIYIASQTLNLATKVPRLFRFAGISSVLATQVASSNTGIPTEIRTLHQAKILLGARPNRNNRALALGNPDEVPEVPDYIAADEDGAARGVGVFEFEGQRPGVFKSFFTSPAQVAAWLRAAGARMIDEDDAEPTRAQIYKYVESKIEGVDDDAPVDVGPERGPGGRTAEQIARDMGDTDAFIGEGLDPFQRANARRHAAANPGRPTAKERAEYQAPTVIESHAAQAERCASCGEGFVNPTTGACTKCRTVAP